jgi:hypothetical protein
MTVDHTLPILIGINEPERQEQYTEIIARFWVN